MRAAKLATYANFPKNLTENVPGRLLGERRKNRLPVQILNITSEFDAELSDGVAPGKLFSP
jgi:hypothetical protein